jgi:hypothetical protein
VCSRGTSGRGRERKEIKVKICGWWISNTYMK